MIENNDYSIAAADIADLVQQRASLLAPNQAQSVPDPNMTDPNVVATAVLASVRDYRGGC